MHSAAAAAAALRRLANKRALEFNQEETGEFDLCQTSAGHLAPPTGSCRGGGGGGEQRERKSGIESGAVS